MSPLSYKATQKIWQCYCTTYVHNTQILFSTQLFWSLDIVRNEISCRRFDQEISLSTLKVFCSKQQIYNPTFEDIDVDDSFLEFCIGKIWMAKSWVALPQSWAFSRVTPWSIVVLFGLKHPGVSNFNQRWLCWSQFPCLVLGWWCSCRSSVRNVLASRVGPTPWPPC